MAVFASISFSSAADVGYPLIRTYTSTEIGGDATSWAMAQDRRGELYFGSNSLLTFDGDRWKTSSLKGGYAIRALDFGEDGRLWAAAAGEIGWFERDQTGEWEFHSLRKDLPAEHTVVGEVWHVWAEGTGAIFVSAEKIYRWDGKKFEIWSLPGSRRLTAMRIGRDVYVHHSPTGLYKIEAGGPKKFIDASVLGRAPVIWMELARSGCVIATYDGLFNYQNSVLTPFGPEASEAIRRGLLISVTRISEDKIACGTFRGGIILVRNDGSIERTLNESDGLPTKSIYSLGMDRERALWATSNSCIFRIAIDSKTVAFDRRGGLPPQSIRTIARYDGRTWVGTDGGIFSLKPGDRTFHLDRNLLNSASSLLSTEHGLLMAGADAVAKLDNGKLATLRKTEHDAFAIRASLRWPGGILISEGRSILLADGTGHSRVLVTDLPDIVTSIIEDSDGKLWLGTTTSGLLVAQPSETGPVKASISKLAEPILGANKSAYVAGDQSQNVFVFTENGGWTLNKEGTALVPIDNFPARKLSAISQPDSSGAFWAALAQTEFEGPTIGQISHEGLHVFWKPHFVEGLETLGTLWSVASENVSNSTSALWIAGAKGILRNDVQLGPNAPRPRRPLLLARVTSDEFKSPAPLEGSLPYSTRSVYFEFSEPEFALRPSLRLETKIDGIDDQWVPADPTSRRELTAVRDGNYTFNVRAVAATGAVSETTSLKFEVLPPWWRTAPAIAGALLALLPLGYGAYRLRVRSLHRRNVELEEKVGQRTEQLAFASAAKTQFVASMSHDIRNPLNGIVGLALALEDTPLDPRQREMVSTLRECSTYLSTLVDDVLDFASIEAGHIELRPSPFSPAELLRSVATTLKADADSRGAILIVDAGVALPESLLGDAGRIQQILVNYVSNALKYAGGAIRIGARVPVESQGEIEFTVADEGGGISAEEQSGLFAKFHRLEGAQKSAVKGSGLGLASCRILADLMGGSVGVASSIGAGARFFLRLPLTITDAPAAVPVLADLPNTTVLLVEDADYNAWAASAVLAKLGLRCERARNGAEAIRLFSERRFNLVLLDRNLPDMDGTEVARRIRTLEEDGPRAILLAVTAYCTPEDRAVCIEAGMDAFVGKPLTPEKLRKILIAAGRRLLTAASMHVAPPAFEPVIDVGLLGYISDGTDEGLDEQVERFLEALADGEARLAAAARSRDFVTLGDAAHFVMSQARMVGSRALAEAAASLESAALARDAFAFGEFVERVHREVRAVTAAMRRGRTPVPTA